MGERKIHWVSKETLGLPKNDKGMGFCNLKEFNLTFLARQCLRLIHSPYSLWAQVNKQQYFPDYSFFEAKKGGWLRGRGLVFWREKISLLRELIGKF